MIDLLEELPNAVLNWVLHPPFRPDPTVETTLVGLGLLVAALVGIKIYNSREKG